MHSATNFNQTRIIVVPFHPIPHYSTSPPSLSHASSIEFHFPLWPCPTNQPQSVSQPVVAVTRVKWNHINYFPLHHSLHSLLAQQTNRSAPAGDSLPKITFNAKWNHIGLSCRYRRNALPVHMQGKNSTSYSYVLQHHHQHECINNPLATHPRIITATIHTSSQPSAHLQHMAGAPRIRSERQVIIFYLSIFRPSVRPFFLPTHPPNLYP